MTRLLLWVLIAFCVLGIIASICRPSLDHGTIIDKNHGVIPMAGGGLAFYWTLTLRDGDQIGYHDVNEWVYKRYSIGDPYP